jgi:hypothetical protein
VDDDHPNLDGSGDSLESREPSVEDLVELCRHLNELGAQYLVIGGFALRAAGLDRRTMDIDLLVARGVDNERRVIEALCRLPDRAASELRPGELEEFEVVRVADEIVVDLMTSASGFDFAAASADIVMHHVAGVAIPCASPRLLWRMKRDSVRDKDRADIHFLRLLLQQAGEPLD